MLNTYEPNVRATIAFLDQLAVKVSKTTVENDLQNHPDYPSLLAISDVLNSYGIENLSLKISAEKLQEMPTPFMAVIKGKNEPKDFVTVIKSFSNNGACFYEPEKKRWETAEFEVFAKNWLSGIILIADAESAVGEKDYNKKVRGEKRLLLARYSSFWALPILAIIATVGAILNNGLVVLGSVFFTLFLLLGSIVSGLLLWYELDEYNPLLKQICSAGKKVNCSAILNSSSSTIFGISWSSIGFTYFMGGLLVLLFMGIANPAALFLLAWLNVLAVPYIFYSIYYQWRVAKQWCILCLCIQGLLTLQFVSVLLSRWYIIPIADIFTIQLLLPIATAYLLPFIIINLLLPAYRANKESKRNKAELQRLKHNPQIFNALLAKQKVVTNNPEGLGIILGSPNATNRIIKVCNPYCPPCARAHIPMEELLHNNPDLQIQILFNATNNDGDYKTPPVKHLLAIAEQHDETLTKQALDDWYLNEKKDYEVFAAKYPMNNIHIKNQSTKQINTIKEVPPSLKNLGEAVDAMYKWCKKTEVHSTPTFFISLPSLDGKAQPFYQLPEMYSVSDLKYFLSV